MGEVIEVESLDWQPVRPEITHGVYGRMLLADGVKAVLTRVAPGGKFSLHQDHYGHLFYFISGEGIVQVQEKQFHAHAGLVVRIPAGEPHAYENSGSQDLVLLSLNLPTS
jgi:mannose-6-phosphate isomerase-like protein (cupin superfamily)